MLLLIMTTPLFPQPDEQIDVSELLDLKKHISKCINQYISDCSNNKKPNKNLEIGLNLVMSYYEKIKLNYLFVDTINSDDDDSNNDASDSSSNS